ncbi:hypothetical protein HYC85_010395 [Camellia sinensis]|uniref:Uncharacterized protein n=1 Tax=Camellia sinensis TaxID=4442 RepID=A0A7J7HJN5_CAMSI|nr:hypothetical protein HYC85_010395 [Camellia sinensis]
MASSAAPSTLMLSHGRFLSSSPTPHPLLSNNWIDVSSPNSPVVVAALAAEAELAEETEQLQEGVVVTPTKPKKGKAALPLNSDRSYLNDEHFNPLESSTVASEKDCCGCSRRRSNRFLKIQKLRENKKEYDLKTAISLLKQMASTKFVETAEAHFLHSNSKVVQASDL